MKTFKYDGAPKRLSRIVAERIPLLSYNQIQRLIKDKEIRINGRRVSADTEVPTGAEISVYIKDFTLKKIYSDENIAIVYKTKGLASEGDSSAESIMRGENTGYVLCHRLDTNTDGLLVFAANGRAYEEIAAAFKNRRVEKRYKALVYGRVESPAVLRDYLIKDAEQGKATVISKPARGAAEIVTQIAPIEIMPDRTLLDITLHTGKTHQIRAHLAFYGHFVLGDGKYGRDDINRRLGFKKQQLTAYKLCFDFPPDSFLSYLNQKVFEI